MRLNWGTGLFIFILVFLGLCISFMIFAFRQNINLVKEDYYEKSVDFGNERDKSERSASFIQQITVENIDKSVIITFPDSFVSEIQNAEILFYRPSDDRQDVRFKLTCDTMILPSKNFIPGRYIVKISWMRNNESYLIDKEFSVR